MSDQLTLPNGFKRLVFSLLRENEEEELEGGSQLTSPPSAFPPVDTGGAFVPWPSEVSAIKYDDGPPGEKRLAEMFGAADPQGPYSTFDIAAPDGTRWEVKQPDKSGVVKGGTLSTQATAPFRESIRRVAGQISKLHGNVEITAADPGITAAIDDFMKRPTAGYSSIKRDEITMGAARRVVEILKRLKQFSAGGEARVRVDLGGGTSDAQVSRDTALKIAKIAGIRVGDLAAEPVEVAVSSIDSDALMNPEEWLSSIADSIKIAAETFGHVAGVILVSNNGYRVIPKSEIVAAKRKTDDGKDAGAFEFLGTTQARGKFRVKEQYKLPR